MKIPMRAAPGTKFIIMFTLPSGTKMAAGFKNGEFALVPVPESGMMEYLLAWDDTIQMSKWLSNFRAKVGEMQWDKWKSLNPQIRRIEIAQ